MLRLSAGSWDMHMKAMIFSQNECAGVHEFYYTDAVARSFAFFGQGTGPISLDDAACTGDENALINCSINLSHNCVHSEDASVTCNGAVTLTMVHTCVTSAVQ